MNQRFKLIKHFFEENEDLFEKFYIAFIKQHNQRYRRKAFIEYCQLHLFPSHIHMLFMSAFAWSETKEGSNYWFDINNKWEYFIEKKLTNISL